MKDLSNEEQGGAARAPSARLQFNEGTEKTRRWTAPAVCDTRPMAEMRELADRLENAAAAFVDLAPAIEAGEPWPLTDVYAPGPESAWGPREVLAHVSEMLPFWLGEIELVLAETGRAAEGADPPAFGRTEQDPLRIELIGRDRMFPARELIDRIDVEGARVARRLRALSAAEAATKGRHTTRGDLSVTEMAERFLVTHLEGHVTQMKDTLATAR